MPKWCLRAHSKQAWKTLLEQKGNSQHRVSELYHLIVHLMLILALNKKQITDWILPLRQFFPLKNLTSLQQMKMCVCVCVCVCVCNLLIRCINGWWIFTVHLEAIGNAGSLHTIRCLKSLCHSALQSPYIYLTPQQWGSGPEDCRGFQSSFLLWIHCGKNPPVGWSSITDSGWAGLVNNKRIKLRSDFDLDDRIPMEPIIISRMTSEIIPFFGCVLAVENFQAKNKNCMGFIDQKTLACVSAESLQPCPTLLQHHGW